MTAHNVGIIGYGGFGKFLHNAWQKLEQIKVIAIADAIASRKPEGDIKFYTRWQDLVQNKNIEIVAVVTPPSTHAEIACAALQAGKHIFLEKPIAITIDDAKKIICTRDETSNKAVINYMMRFNPIIESLGLLARARVFGELRRVDVENYAQDSSLPAEHWFWNIDISGGILIEHGVHFIDVVHSLTNAKYASVNGLVSSHYIQNENQVLANVLYDNGVIATHYHSFSRPGFFEDTSIRLSFDLAQIDIHGWIPLTGEIRALVNDLTTEKIKLLPGLKIEQKIPLDQIEDISRPEGWGENVQNIGEQLPHKIRSGGVMYDVDQMIKGTFQISKTKAQVYSDCVRSVMLDLVRSLEESTHKLRANLEDGLISLEVASLATKDGRAFKRI